MPQGDYPNGGRPEKPRHTGLKVTMIVVCVLVLIAASVYVVRSDLGLSLPMERDFFWDFSLPGLTPPAAGDAAGDYREFFNNLFSQPEESSGSRMERTAGGASGEISVVPAGGREELSLRELYQSCIDSIVGVRSYYDNLGGYGWGSGIVMSADGYILTNQHMVDEAVRAVVVLSDGAEYDALLVGEDAQTDLAVLKIEAEGLSPAEFGDSDVIEVGDRVAAIGNPLGSELSGTMTDGIISAINRDVKLNGRTMTLLQTNAAINSGSSGGALVNMYGQIVGVTFMKLSGVSSSSVTIEGIGFAIPSVTVKSVSDQLLLNGVVSGRPGLGLTMAPVSAALAERFGVPEGLYIYSVAQSSDAWAKGVRPGDILTRIDGAEVRGTLDVLEKRDALAVGDTMTLTLWRDGTVFDVDVALVDQNTLA